MKTELHNPYFVPMKENIFNSDKGRKNMDLWRHYHGSLIDSSLLLDTLEDCKSYSLQFGLAM